MNFNRIQNDESLLTKFQELSWIFKILDGNVNWMVLKFASMAHISLCQFGTAFAVQYTLLLTDCLKDRIKTLESSIVYAGLPNIGKMSTSQFSKYKEFSVRSDAFAMSLQVIDLQKYFVALNAATGLIVFVFVSATTASVTVLVFACSSQVNVLDLTQVTERTWLALAILIHLIMSVVKLMWMANAGESLRKTVSLNSDYLPMPNII
jgi:succinate dehydrogenase/fumarate reductase cytochrome b subunit